MNRHPFDKVDFEEPYPTLEAPPPIPTGYVPHIPKAAHATTRPNEPQSPDPVRLAGQRSDGTSNPDSGSPRDKPNKRPPSIRPFTGRVHEVESIVQTGPHEEGKRGFYRLVITYKIPKAQFLGALARLLGKS